MRKAVKWAGAVVALSLCALLIIGIVWIRQYQALEDAEPDVVLSPPSMADVTYCTVDGSPLKMDLYLPGTEKGMPVRVLVYVHGGSFTGGDKRKGSGIVDIPAMIDRGYAVAAVNYRLMPGNPFPSEIQDAKCAIRYLRAHAATYNLNVEKIGIWGGSAGGHLAAMVGLTDGEPEFEAGEYLEQSSRVAAVAEMFGPADLTVPTGWLQRMLLNRAFGTSDPASPLLRLASPVNYATGNEPPFLILHGEQDTAVPVAQAKMLHEQLTHVGVDASLVLVKNANHNFKPTGGAIEPTRQEISRLMGEFFDRTLQ